MLKIKEKILHHDLPVASLESVKELSNMKISSLEEGKRVIESINVEVADLMLRLRETQDNHIHKLLTDKHYEYIKARRNIQNQMGRIVRGK